MLNTFWELLLSSTSQGLLWSLMAIGVYLTFRILDLADMTAEGSFPLGGAVATMCIIKGINPILATIAAFVGGCRGVRVGVRVGVSGADVPPSTHRAILVSVCNRQRVAVRAATVGTRVAPHDSVRVLAVRHVY